MRAPTLIAFSLSLSLALLLAVPAPAGDGEEPTLEEFYERGRKHEAARDFKGAVWFYDRILEVDKEYEDAFERREACQPLVEWQESVCGEPTALDLVRLGEALCGAGRIEEEREAYRAAIEKDPGCTDAHGHLAMSNYTAEGGSILTVIRETTLFLKTSPHRKKLGRAIADFSVYGELRTIRAILEDEFDASHRAQEAGELREAAVILLGAIRAEHPDVFATTLHAVAGGHLLAAGEKERARAAFTEALEHAVCRYTMDAYLGLAALDAGEGKLGAALGHLRAAVAEGSRACRTIDEEREGKYEALFTAEDEKVRAAAEELTDAEKADEPIRAEIRAARARAGKEGKLVLLMWYGPYCPYVMAMEERLAHPEVVSVLEKHFVLVRMDQGSLHRGVTLDAEYGDVMRRLGVPSFFVLYPDGTIKTVQKDAEFMGVPHRCFDAGKIAAWLLARAGETVKDD